MRIVWREGGIYTNGCTDDTNASIPPRLVQALLLCRSHISMISPRPDPILAELLELLRYYFRFLDRDSAGFMGWHIIKKKARKGGRKEGDSRYPTFLEKR